MLGDSAGSPRFIETLPRRGYRLVVRVEFSPLEFPHGAVEPIKAGEPAVALAGERAAGMPVSARRNRSWIVLAAGIAASALITLAVIARRDELLARSRPLS